MNDKIILKYIGNGSALIGVPARDLTKNDIDWVLDAGFSMEHLLASGLYELAETKQARKPFKKDKDEEINDG